MRRVPPLVTFGAVVILTCQATGTPAFAQGLEWWRSDDIQRQLRLTTEQVQMIDVLVKSTLQKRRTLRMTLDREEEALEDAIARDDEKRALDLIPRVEAARAARNRERTLLLLRIYRVLTPEQRRELSRIEARRRRQTSANR